MERLTMPVCAVQPLGALAEGEIVREIETSWSRAEPDAHLVRLHIGVVRVVEVETGLRDLEWSAMNDRDFTDVTEQVTVMRGLFETR